MSRIRHYSRIPLGQGNIIFRLFVSPSLSLSSLLFSSLFSSPSISLSFDRLLRRRLSEFDRGEILFPSLTPPSCPVNNYFPRRSLSNPISKLSIFGAVSISEDVRGGSSRGLRLLEFANTFRENAWHPPMPLHGSPAEGKTCATYNLELA